MQGIGKYQKAVADYLTELKIISGVRKIEMYATETPCRDGISIS